MLLPVCRGEWQARLSCGDHLLRWPDVQRAVCHRYDLIYLPTIIETGMIFALMCAPALGTRQRRQCHRLRHQQHVSEVEPIDQHRIEAARGRRERPVADAASEVRKTVDGNAKFITGAERPDIV